ncbi:helix-turn-helix domain-containing protein [Ichthyenterobacterium magnum]|uniref:Helix-turn-helix protein n=1 Tax=Ichthyenterobacterium magnum TaxID=1230530 RepID=A0A420DXS5_9FLAO|nr:helix-turn-helix transcriptional regulator [Ichthyenterobacterium magnum]RKE99038.1 helix-turn-helix protein [Ichthyenterobacterium magnum]
MIGERIKKTREKKGFSQEYIAEELKISQSAYSDLENNKTKLNLQRLQKIADVLDTDIFEFLSGADVTFNDNQNGGVANNAFVINQLSDQLLNQYEKRLKEKDDIISLLKEQLKTT